MSDSYRDKEHSVLVSWSHRTFTSLTSFRPEDIAAGVVELCNDTSKVGATMVALPKLGLGYLMEPANLQELLPQIRFLDSTKAGN